MIRLFLIISLLIVEKPIISQDCNRYLKSDVNNYSDSKAVETYWIILDKKDGYLKLNLKRRKLEVDYSSNSKTISDKNDTLLFKFDNGKNIELIAPRRGSENYLRSDGIPTKWKNTYLGSLELLDNLSSSNLISIEEKRKGTELKTNKKSAKALIEAANCFYNEIDTLKDIQPYYLKRNVNECDFFEYKVDNFSDKTRKRVAYTTIGFKGQTNDFNSFALVGSLFDFGVGYGLDIRVNSSNYCTDNNSYIMIKLVNNEIIKINSSSGIGCGEGSNFRCYLNDDDINNLKQSKIKVIRLMTAEGFIDIENITYPEYFINQLKCLEN